MTRSGSPEKAVRFGAFEADLAAGELRKEGVRLQVQEQPFQVLTVLLERPGEVVSREELIRRLWPEGTHVDFDRGLNAAVTRLRQVLLDSAEAPRYVETVARRGYRFIAPVLPASGPEETAPDTAGPAPPAEGRFRSRWLKLSAAGILVLVALLAVWLIRGRDVPPPRVAPLTTTPGNEMYPSLSPDGDTVAFTWDGEKEDNLDIYVKAVGSATALRLTMDAADDAFPSWSPDGRQIAFLKRAGQRVAIYVISPLGGPERKLLDFSAAAARPTWSPDGNFLVVARAYRLPQPEEGAGSLFVVPVHGGEPRALIAPKRGGWFHYPAISPDGRELAYVSCTGSTAGPICHLQVLQLTAGLTPNGTARTITGYFGYFSGVAWLPEGRSLIFSGGTAIGSYLFRVDARGARSPERLEIASQGAVFPAIAARNDRLAFSRSHADVDIWRLHAGRPEPLLVSTMVDWSPDFSPDGSRIAFATSRSADRVAIWLANADGSGATQLTTGPETTQGSPKWSPNGQQIAFDAKNPDGSWSIRVVDSGGGQPRLLAGGAFSNLCPGWSRDGTYIYFGSDRSGRFEIWRMPAAGGAAEQITRNGGSVALESTDGKSLYYTKTGLDGPLYASGTDGSGEKQISDRIVARAFAASSSGVYYVVNRGPSRNEIRFYEPATGKDRAEGVIEGKLSYGFTVSPDRGTFLFTLARPPAYDLMLIDNFR